MGEWKTQWANEKRIGRMNNAVGEWKTNEKRINSEYKANLKRIEVLANSLALRREFLVLH